MSVVDGPTATVTWGCPRSVPDSDPDDPLADRREQTRREGLAAVER
ncbi:hypothetical protein [Halobaculum sp. MBLA0143]